MKVTTDACLFGGSIPPAPSGGGRIYHALDIGTGTGLLSLMVAQLHSNATIDAIEIDERAAAQAKENIEASPWKERINIICADARNYPFSKKYNIIFSNPPFYEDELKSDDPVKNIARHGEALALKDILSIIENNLAHDGIFSLLLPYKRYAAIQNLFIQSTFELTSIFFVKQSPLHNYFRMIFQGRFRTGEMIETEINEITICDEKGEYTPSFAKLLQPFYLKL